MNKKFFMSSIGNLIPEPPVGAEVFYWHGLEGLNWSEKTAGGRHTLTRNSDNLSIKRIDSSGGVDLANFQTSEVYVGGAGKTLYLKYEVVSIGAGSITSMMCNLEDIPTSGGNVSALVNISSFAVDGLHLVNSPGTTDGQAGYAPKIEFISNNALFEIKIYELYYL